jgi:hypothetical protein
MNQIVSEALNEISKPMYRRISDVICNKVERMLQRQDQPTLVSQLSELQAEFQRFRADMEARTQQADNSATVDISTKSTSASSSTPTDLCFFCDSNNHIVAKCPDA